MNVNEETTIIINTPYTENMYKDICWVIDEIIGNRLTPIAKTAVSEVFMEQVHHAGTSNAVADVTMKTAKYTQFTLEDDFRRLLTELTLRLKNDDVSSSDDIQSVMSVMTQYRSQLTFHYLELHRTSTSLLSELLLDNEIPELDDYDVKVTPRRLILTHYTIKVPPKLTFSCVENNLENLIIYLREARVRKNIPVTYVIIQAIKNIRMDLTLHETVTRGSNVDDEAILESLECINRKINDIGEPLGYVCTKS